MFLFQIKITETINNNNNNNFINMVILKKNCREVHLNYFVFIDNLAFDLHIEMICFGGSEW